MTGLSLVASQATQDDANELEVFRIGVNEHGARQQWTFATAPGKLLDREKRFARRSLRRLRRGRADRPGRPCGFLQLALLATGTPTFREVFVAAAAATSLALSRQRYSQPAATGMRQHATVRGGHQAQEIGGVITLGVGMRHAFLIASQANRHNTSCAIRLAMGASSTCQ